MAKKTVCLVMIVKNEAHVITNTLRQLVQFIPFDYWCISDTGSTDTTKKDITAFFKERGIPGEIYDTEWRDFGYNRTVAFQKAYKKTDYAFVWDADDEICGKFVFPENLNADSYKFMFGNDNGLRYERVQLFNNRKRWEYVGVLHEYPRCIEDAGPNCEVFGDYYFVSGRSGARNKNPNKYQDDARILEKAYKEAREKNDDIYKRYAFYCAQSYSSAKMDEKAIEHYKNVLTIDTWHQEKYMSCLSIYESYEKLGKEHEGLFYLLESFKYDPKRVECIYRLIKYYCIHGPSEASFLYYSLIQSYYENEYPTETFANKLFVNKEDYDFYLPYYMTITADRVKRPDVCAKMFGYIFKYKYTGTSQWWIDNLFSNLQFSVDLLPLNIEFLQNIFDYVNLLRNKNIVLDEKRNGILTRIIHRYAPLLTARPSTLPILSLKEKPRVMLTMTTCKRYDLFVKTVHSILNTWTDIDSVDYFFCVDDNSSEEDRANMVEMFPFFDYYMKTPEEKGHRQSMNIIWDKLNTVRPKYWIHLEDDWMYFHRGPYVERAIQFLERHEDKNIHQLVFNRNYGVVYIDLRSSGGIPMEPGYLMHQKSDNLPGLSSGYWPHYSLQPSISRVSAILEVGPYDSPNSFFERGQADKYNDKGFKTSFFNGIFSIHIGKQHWEKEGKNAYQLNEVLQNVNSEKKKVLNSPLTGTMEEHLQAILKKIENKTPFGIIRPSDGEYAVLLNENLTNCDSWTFKSGGILREQLTESVATKNPNLYIGIPCNSCNLPWNCTQKIYRDFIHKFKVPVEQRTYANIFGNANWEKFVDFLMNYAPGFYLVSSAVGEGKLPIKGRLVINERLVNNWDNVHKEETARVTEYVKTMEGELVCFSAGPLSKIWIPLCMKANPKNMYVDIGASMDFFTKGLVNRPYADPRHPFKKISCMFVEETAEPKKNLIYTSVFHPTFVGFLKMLLTSYKFYSKTENTDFLIYTSAECEPAIRAIGDALNLPLKFVICNLKTVEEMSLTKIAIFDYEHIGDYGKVLCLDSDVLIQGDINKLFSENFKDVLHALPERTIQDERYGGWFFDFLKADKTTPGMNTEIMLFYNSDTIRKTFQEVRKHMKEMQGTNGRMPDSFEQPFINYHFIKDGKYATDLIQGYVSNFTGRGQPRTDTTICHFLGPFETIEEKLKAMEAHYTHIIRNFTEIYPIQKDLAVTPEMCKRYIWEKGYVHFSLAGVVHTSWKEGRYMFTDATTMQARWSIHEHIIKFTKDYTAYVGIHKGTLAVTRGVIEPESAYIYEDCVIQDVECVGMTVPTSPKYMVYACVFHKKGYVDLLKILLTSYAFFSRKSNIDFVVFTSEEFKAEILEFGRLLDISLDCHICNFPTKHESFCARLHVFNYKKIHRYTKALYLDTDIVIQGDLLKLFEINIDNRLYAMNEGTIEHEIHGGWFFDFRTVDRNQESLNSGVLLFNVCGPICSKFNSILTHISRMKQRGGRMPECFDQPFLNYHFIKDGLQELSLINKHAMIYCSTPCPPPPSAPTDISICHFVWPLGDAEHKLARMNRHFSHILKNYRSIYGVNTEFDHDKIMWKRYSWNNGYIEFNPNGVLLTLWVNGHYEVLGPRTIKATWGNYEHIVHFSDNFYRYTSVRTNDLVISFGKQAMNPICIYGDSHASTLFNSLPLPHTNLFRLGKTMYSVGRDCRIINYDEKDIDRESTVCLVYGEVDVRCHIGKYAAQGKDVGKLCEEIVDKYLAAVCSLIKTYKRIIIVAAPPPTDPADHSKAHPEHTDLPFIGTNEERVAYTQILNSFLQVKCIEYAYLFLNPYELYTREDGCLNYRYSDGCIHIQQNAHFLSELEKIL